MNNLFTLALLNAAAMAKLRCSPATESQFLGFAAEYGKDYQNVGELEMRLEIFQANKNEVEEMNKHAVGVTFRLNENSDLTNAEYRIKNGLKIPKEVEEGLRHLDDSSDDDSGSDSDDSSDDSDDSSDDEGRQLQSSGRSLNWGVTDFMAGVKSQGSCGSCWAFAATSVQEGVQAIKS